MEQFKMIAQLFAVLIAGLIVGKLASGLLQGQGLAILGGAPPPAG